MYINSRVIGNSGAAKIGIWEYYNENGQLISSVDEDKKYGEFGYYELFTLLEKEGVIDLETGENWENLSIAYLSDPRSTPKIIWSVILKDINTHYYIDGKTGEIISKKQFYFE